VKRPESDGKLNLTRTLDEPRAPGEFAWCGLPRLDSTITPGLRRLSASDLQDLSDFHLSELYNEVCPPFRHKRGASTTVARNGRGKVLAQPCKHALAPAAVALKGVHGGAMCVPGRHSRTVGGGR